MLGGDGGLLKRTKGNMAHRELLYLPASLYHSSTQVIKQSGGQFGLAVPFDGSSELCE